MVMKMSNKFKFIIMFVLLMISLVLGILFGGAKLSFNEVIQGLFVIDNSVSNVIIYNIRLPRILACIIAGTGLSLSGLILQSVTNNNLASPNIIGVNAGAGLFVIILLYFMPKALYLLPIVAFIGAFLTTLLIIFISKKVGVTSVSIILSGIAITTLINAIISFVTMLDGDVLISYNYFSLGGVNGISVNQLIIPSVLIIICYCITFILSNKLDILMLGDDISISLGINVKKIKFILLMIASLSSASVVSFAGLLGFIGLVVPHVCRKLVGNKTKNILISSVFIGSIIMILGDLLGRTLFAPSEIPVGIVMALIGAPFFLFLLLRGKYARV